MIVRNELSGALHEVPDNQLYEVEPVYNGFGFLTNIVRGVRNLFSPPRPPVPMPFRPGALPVPGGGLPVPGGFPTPGGFPAPGGFPMPGVPPGWIQPPIPYTGMQPRRLYMRCSTWRGVPGLVPASAASAVPGMPGIPGMPGQPGFPPAMPGIPAMAGRGRRRRSRGRRR
jgi:hypothetical protein